MRPADVAAAVLLYVAPVADMPLERVTPVPSAITAAAVHASDWGARPPGAAAALPAQRTAQRVCLTGR